MSWSLLERFLESDHFNNDPSLAVAYLSRYSHHVGIQYVLCSKLRRFDYEEIEFFLPQLCHLLVSQENESMALEDFILDLCQESVSGALLTFWLFQTHLHDLASSPHLEPFKTCRRIFNKVQNIVFGGSESPKAEKIHENVLPVSVLASIVMASVAAPFLPRDLGPLAIAQARKPRPLENTISEAPPVQQRLTRSHTVSGGAGQPLRKKKLHHTRADSAAVALAMQQSGEQLVKDPKPKPKPKRIQSYEPFPDGQASVATERLAISMATDSRPSTSSLPDFTNIPALHSPEPSSNTALFIRPDLHEQRRYTASSVDGTSEKKLNRTQMSLLLRSNYFRNEMSFLSALEGISMRLVALPKPARLSALRAELALVARDLPSEVDIPLICPASLDDGTPSKSRHHRVVRINPAEATSLNSAERVPYLLMIEVLREDFDFNPDNEENQALLETLLTQTDTNKRRPFDINAAARASVEFEVPSGPDSVSEPLNGDLSSTDLLKDFAAGEAKVDFGLLGKPRSVTPVGVRGLPTASGGNTTAPSPKLSVPRATDQPTSRSASPIPRRGTFPNLSGRTANSEAPDLSALATHMRTAAQMLAQLDVSSSKRPRAEVQAIKDKIIASMQSLEEQNFNNDDSVQSTTFDTIIADVQRHTDTNTPPELEGDLEGANALKLNSGAGAARMENDQKTGGIQRKGDRDDPSAATFGEEWKNKRERIRRTSPYGSMKTWDLLSVIVKTGSDLRQEMFACQLIRICAKIWEDAAVPVWVKQMKILVTGESSGLIETITNGVSLHSLKRSLTLSSIAAGTNPKKRFATLKDHFVRTFGEPDTPAYKAAEDAFIRSLAAYSILSYILQLKDRHNGNILIDNVGHIIHIDFGFILSNSPGGMGVEAAPFKLTQEYVDVLGGANSPAFDQYKALCKQAFQALRKSAENIVSVVEMMGKESKMACFASGGVSYATTALRIRFALHLSREEAENFVETDLITKSLGSYYTKAYDIFQYRTQGIY